MCVSVINRHAFKKKTMKLKHHFSFMSTTFNEYFKT